MKTGINLITEERQRQIDVEGWTKLHDSKDHANMELSAAAGCYIANAINKNDNEENARFQVNFPPESDFFVNSGDRGDRRVSPGGWEDGWPWSSHWDKRQKHDKLRSLVIAGALIAAEIDRLQNKQP